MGHCINSDPPPPPKKAELWKPPQGRTDLLLLGDCLGKWVHWLGKRSFLCLGDDCPTPRHRLYQRWIGYYPAALSKRGALDPQTGKFTSLFLPIVFCGTPEHFEELKPYQSYPLLLTLEKKGAKESPVILKVKELPSAAGLPPVFDPWITVARVFGVRPDPPARAQGEEQERD